MLRKITLISLFLAVSSRLESCNIIAKEDLFRGIQQEIVPTAWNQLENPTIPDHTKKGGHHLKKWSYSITGCASSISSLDKNSIRIILSQQANTLTLQIDNIEVSAHCDAHVKTKILRTHGSVSTHVKFSRIAATLSPTYYDRGDGLRAPDFNLVSSVVEASDIHIHVNIHRVPGFLDNLISDALKEVYGSKIKQKLKESLDRAIHKELERIRTTTKLQNEIDDTGLQFVYELASAPIIHDTWIQIPLDCTVYPISSPTLIRPDIYAISPLPKRDTISNSEIHISDYLVNSFLWAAAMKPYIIPINNANLYLKKIEPFMTTSYFSRIIPQFAQFDDSHLEGLLYLSQEHLPKASITENSISTDVKIVFELYFAQDQEKGARFELDATIKAKMRAGSGDQENMMLLYGQIQELQLASCIVVSSSIGQLQVRDLTILLQGVLALAKNELNAKVLNEPYPISKMAMRLVEVEKGSLSLKAGHGTIGLNIEPDIAP